MSPLHEVLHGPITVIHTNGRAFIGLPRKVTDKQIEIAAENGAVEYTFAREDVRHVILPGRPLITSALERLDATEPDSDAITLLEGLYIHCIPYFAYLPEVELLEFLPLLEANAEGEKVVAAVAFGEQLIPYLKNENARARVNAILLLAYFKLGVDDKVATRLTTWLTEAQPFQDTTLGWWIHALREARREKFEEALEAALYPITFSSDVAPRDLHICYAIAVHAAMMLGESSYAALLYHEMRDRGLGWPENLEFPDPNLPKPRLETQEHRLQAEITYE